MAPYALERLMILGVLFLFSVSQKSPQGKYAHRNDHNLDIVNKINHRM